jgi:hypothetical protein
MNQMDEKSREYPTLNSRDNDSVPSQREEEEEEEESCTACHIILSLFVSSSPNISLISLSLSIYLTLSIYLYRSIYIYLSSRGRIPHAFGRHAGGVEVSGGRVEEENDHHSESEELRGEESEEVDDEGSAHADGHHGHSVGPVPVHEGERRGLGRERWKKGEKTLVIF